MARRSETHDGKVTTGSAGCTGSLRGTITTFCRNLKNEHVTIPNSKDADDSVVYAAGAPPVFLDIKKRKSLRRRRASALDVLPTAATVITSFVLEIASFLRGESDSPGSAAEDEAVLRGEFRDEPAVRGCARSLVPRTDRRCYTRQSTRDPTPGLSLP